MRRWQPGRRLSARRLKTLDLVEMFQRHVDVVDAADESILA